MRKSCLDSLVNRPGGNNAEEEFKNQHVLVEKTEILSLYIPEMLRRKQFLNKVFFGEAKQSFVIDWLDDLLSAAYDDKSSGGIIQWKMRKKELT